MIKQNLQLEIKERILVLDEQDLKEVVGYLNHLDEVRLLTNSKQSAMKEIQAALQKEFSF